MVREMITVGNGADGTSQVSEETGSREGIRTSERRIAASVVGMVREIKPDMSTLAGAIVRERLMDCGRCPREGYSPLLHG
jgi:hypothetical protein